MKTKILISVFIGVLLTHVSIAQCITSPAPADECANAPLILTSGAYCQTTSGYTADSPNWLNTATVFGGSTVENSSYYKFTANNTKLKFKVCASTCGYYGIQILIFNGTCNGTINKVYYVKQICDGCGSLNTSGGTGITSSYSDIGSGCYSFTLTGLTVGNEYYYMTDGYEGSKCTYTVQFNDGVSLLPIELADFTSDCENNHVKLSWTTASETNNKQFELQKSNDAINYETIAIIAGQNNSQQINKYSFVDDSFIKTKNVYYRLKQVDYNGNYSYFNKIISSENLCENIDYQTMIYPNPSDKSFTINMTDDTPFNIEIIDEFGQIIYNNVCLNHLDIESVNFAAGIYAIRISNSYKTVIKKLVITH